MTATRRLAAITAVDVMSAFEKGAIALERPPRALSGPPTPSKSSPSAQGGRLVAESVLLNRTPTLTVLAVCNENQVVFDQSGGERSAVRLKKSI
jgi:hypothetical protein